MDAERLIHAVWHELNKNEEEGAKAAMIEILKDAGYHVADGDKELRELALAETDLVEPS